jgi:hypothetical protein
MVENLSRRKKNYPRFGEFFDRDNALKIVASDPKTYQQAYTTVSNILGVWAEVSFTELGIHLGCPQVAPVAEKVIGKHVPISVSMCIF